MSPLAHLLLALACATLCSCGKVPNLPNPCVDLEIGNKSLKLQPYIMEIEFLLEEDLTKHLVDIPDFCGDMVIAIGVTSWVRYQSIVVCRLPLVHLYDLGKQIYSPVVAYCEGDGCKKQQVKVFQQCELGPIIPRSV